MTRTEELLAYVIVALDMIGPIVLLLLLRRLTRRWTVAFPATLILPTLPAFFFTGGEAWLSTYHRVVIRGDTSVPDAEGETVPGYLAMNFIVCGVYGVMFAGTGFGLSLPVVGVWRLVHPRSFHRVTRGRNSAQPT